MLILMMVLGCSGKGTETADTEPIDTGDPLPADVCERWDLVRSAYGMAEWDGSVDTCDAGSVTGESLDTFKRGLNLFRFLADLEPVTLDAGRSAKAQDCALMMHANSDLDQDPPSSWDCYTDDGAEAADSSQLVNVGGVYAIDALVGASGDDELSGRRWMLSNTLGTIGAGFTDRYTCIWLDQDGDSGKEWVAWPPPGQVPHEAAQPADTAGWSWHSDDIEITLTPSVTVEMDGQDMPVFVKVLEENYGSKSAIRFTPQGWRAERDKTYHVTISGLGDVIEYDVEILSCR